MMSYNITSHIWHEAPCNFFDFMMSTHINALMLSYASVLGRELRVANLDFEVQMWIFPTSNMGSISTNLNCARCIRLETCMMEGCDSTPFMLRLDGMGTDNTCRLGKWHADEQRRVSPKFGENH